MHPGTERVPAGLQPADLEAEGEGYARDLLDRIAAGTSGPEELATLMQFLHSGPMLHAACAVLVLALRPALQAQHRGGDRAR